MKELAQKREKILAIALKKISKNQKHISAICSRN